MNLTARIAQIIWFLMLAVGLPTLTILTDAHQLAVFASGIIAGLFWSLAPSMSCFRRNKP